MAESLTLNPSLYADVTPAGAFYAVASSRQAGARRMLMSILCDAEQAPLSAERLLRWAGLDDENQALELLYRLQRLDFVHGSEVPLPLADGSMEVVLPKLLAALSDTGRALLADDNGLYLASVGFTHEAAEEIAALAGDILGLSERHALLLKQNLNINSSAWAITDANGRSELGFFPLHLERQSFVLTIGGTPQLQGDEFVNLVRTLSHRYG